MKARLSCAGWITTFPRRRRKSGRLACRSGWRSAWPTGNRLKILILKPSSLGDVIHALPVARLLKQAYPSSEIHWWISSSLASLLEGDPDLAGLIRFDRKGWSRASRWGNLLRSILTMRAQQFDVVIDLQSLARSGAIAWLANGKLLIGLDDAREGARGFYDVVVPRPSAETHAVDWYLRTLAPLHIPAHWNFDWLPERREVAARVRSRWNAQEFRWVALTPGARWVNKRWPAERFAEAARKISAAHPELRFATLGGGEDREFGAAISAALPDKALDLTGRTTLPEMIEWIRLSELLITNDTGPMHVAAALRKPVVSIFGPTNPRRTGPHGQIESALRVPLPCAPCLKASCSNPSYLECLRLIPSDWVAEAALKHFAC